MSDNLSQVELIRETFHYQSRFKGSTMVFKIDFPVTEDAGFPYLMKDLALLAQTGFKIVIVPGAKESIDALLKEHDIDSAYGVSENPEAENDVGIKTKHPTAERVPTVRRGIFVFIALHNRLYFSVKPVSLNSNVLFCLALSLNSPVEATFDPTMILRLTPVGQPVTSQDWLFATILSISLLPPWKS